MPVFKVVEALIRDERLPEGRGYDAQGTPTQSPQAILKAGALRTFDLGPKSSGLALVVEILSNALTGGCLADDPNNENWGNLALAIDPELLVGKEAFLRNMNRLMTHLKGLRRTDPARAISLPGEVANLRAHEALAAQEVEIDGTATKASLLFGSLIPNLEGMPKFSDRSAKASLITSNPVNMICCGETSRRVRRQRKPKPWNFVTNT